MLAFGAVGYVLVRADCDRGLFVIAFVIGPVLEENIRRALLISRGDLMRIAERPMVGTMMAIAVALLLMLGIARRRSAAA